MANNPIAAVLANNIGLLPLPFFDQATPLGVPFAQWTNGPDGVSPNVNPRPPEFSPIPFRFAHTPNGNVKAAAAAIDIVVRPEAASWSEIWFERIHIMPKSAVDFALIVTQEEDTFEIYNAHRTQSQTLASIVNNALPGIDLPDIATSDVAPPQTSYLRNTTTDNSTGIGLGIIALMRVQALRDGLTTFNAAISFVFSAGTVRLQVAGVRIVLIPFRYEWDPGILDSMEFRTYVNEATAGQKQSIATRGAFPRQILDVRYSLDQVQRQFMRSMLFDVMNKTIAIPIFHEEIELASDIPIGATIYPVSGADDVDLRNGGLAVVISDDYTFDILNLSAVSDTQLTAQDPSLNAYPAGTAVVPVRLAVLPQGVPTSRSILDLEDFRIRYAVKDNETGAMTGSLTPGFWSTYKSKVLFDNCNIMDGSRAGHELDKQVIIVDSAAGSIEVSSTIDGNREVSPRTFSLKSRAQIKAFKRLLIGLRGPQKTFYVVSDNDDFTVAGALVIGASTMDIYDIGYTRFVRSRDGMNELRITFTDGTTLERVVTASETIAGNLERLTLDDSWPDNRSLAEITRVELVQLHQFNQDAFSFRYTQPSFATVRTRTVRSIQ